MCDVPRAAKLTCRGLVNIVSGVLDGGLRHVAKAEGVEGFRSILVDVDEVGGAVLTGKGAIGLDDLARRLRVTRVTALRLVEEKQVAARRTRSPMSRHLVTVVDPEALEVFARNFVSLSELSREVGVGGSSVKERLSVRGFEPAFPFDRVRSVMYRRVEVAAAGDLTRPDPVKAS